MELKYLYIPKFRSISNQGLNFSINDEFEFDPISGIVIIEKRKAYDIDDFFGEQIINISAISGDNGVGKTSLLTFLTSFLSNIHSPSLVVFDNFIFTHRNLSSQEIKVEGELKSQYSIVEYFDGDDVNQDLYKLLMSEFNFIHVSNAFYQNFNPSSQWVVDHTTSNLLAQDFNQFSKPSPKKKISQTLRNKQQDLYRQLNFLNWLDEKKIDHPFETNSLNAIGFYFNNAPNYQNKIRVEDTRLFKWAYERVREFLTNQEISPGYYSIEDKTLSQEWMCGCVLSFMLKLHFDFNLSGQGMLPKTETPTFEAYRTIISNLIHKDERLTNEPYLKVIDAIEALEFDKISTRINLYPGFSHSFFGMFVEDFECDIPRDQIMPFFKLQEVSTFEEVPLFYFSWGLSSGEEAFLNLLSRVHHSFEADCEQTKKKNIVELSKNILLLLDEPSLHFHPEWQRRLINYLVYYIPKIIRKTQSQEDRKVQIIFTTHSPLVISDLPRENVIYLSKDEIRKEQTEEIRTFGGNASEIYADIFNVEDPILGNFARSVIEEKFAPIIEGRQDINTLEFTEMNKIIEMISDEVIREGFRKVVLKKMKL